MTINFGGLKNAGVSMITKPSGEPILYKFWAKPTNKLSNDLEELAPVFKKYPLSDDGFFRVDINTDDVSMADSVISINDKSIKFEEMSKEDIHYVEKVKNFLKKIPAKPDNEFTLSSKYLNDENILNKNAGFNIAAGIEPVEQNNFKQLMHNPDVVKNYSEEMAEVVNNKFTQLFS